MYVTLHVMRKFISIFIIFALMISVSDVIGVNDITLNGKEIFTTDNSCADQDDDDLNSTEIHTSIVKHIICNLPQVITCGKVITTREKHYFNQDTSALPKLTFSLYRPPIA